MKYGIEVRVETRPGELQWLAMHPSNAAKPYAWETKAEADRYLYICYGRSPEFARVVEVLP